MSNERAPIEAAEASPMVHPINHATHAAARKKHGIHVAGQENFNKKTADPSLELAKARTYLAEIALGMLCLFALSLSCWGQQTLTGGSVMPVCFPLPNGGGIETFECNMLGGSVTPGYNETLAPGPQKLAYNSGPSLSTKPWDYRNGATFDAGGGFAFQWRAKGTTSVFSGSGVWLKGAQLTAIRLADTTCPYNPSQSCTNWSYRFEGELLMDFTYPDGTVKHGCPARFSQLSDAQPTQLDQCEMAWGGGFLEVKLSGCAQ
jgi:hypothetical protein